MKRKIAIIMVLIMCFIMCSDVTTTKAYDESSVVATITVNGVKRTLTVHENFELCMQVGDEEPITLIYFINDYSYGIDRYGSVWLLVTDSQDRNYATPLCWNYDLLYPEVYFTGIYLESRGWIENVKEFVFEEYEGQKFIVGYKTFSGDIYPLPTFEELKEGLIFAKEDIKEDVSAPIVSPAVPDELIPIAPTPTPTVEPVPTTEPTQIPVPTPTVAPTAEPKPTEKPLNTTKPSIKKEKTFSCLYEGNKVVSKYKLKKGVLTWNGSTKSKTVKSVLQAGYIEKSKNLIYITKKGKAYTISPKGKKKTILTKGAKKLIFKKKFVIKIKKKSGYVNITKK